MTAAVSRRSWTQTLAGAADVVLAGVLAGLAALPVVTAGAALATASYAIDSWVRDGSWPGPARLWRVFRHGLWPGSGAVACGLAFAGLVAADLAALRSGRVPGGTAMAGATVAVAIAAAGTACAVVAEVGRRGGRDWRGSLRWALRTAASRPWLVPALSGVLGCAAVLVWLIPPLAPLLPGPVLYAVYAVSRQH